LYSEQNRGLLSQVNQTGEIINSKDLEKKLQIKKMLTFLEL